MMSPSSVSSWSSSIATSSRSASTGEDAPVLARSSAICRPISASWAANRLARAAVLRNLRFELAAFGAKLGNLGRKRGNRRLRLVQHVKRGFGPLRSFCARLGAVALLLDGLFLAVEPGEKLARLGDRGVFALGVLLDLLVAAPSARLLAPWRGLPRGRACRVQPECGARPRRAWPPHRAAAARRPPLPSGCASAAASACVNWPTARRASRSCASSVCTAALADA